jgi:hypothetical protein
MEFRLLYEGPLPGQNAKAEDKHRIRDALHPQLQQLWSQPPLCEMTSLLAFPPESEKPSVIVERGPIRYAPLVTKVLNLYAELAVLMFRPQPRGHLITDGGDVDNRLKTLLDALRIPRGTPKTPNRQVPAGGVFYCLLQDDSLVTKVSAETEQLLRPAAAGMVVAVIQVTVKKTRTSFANLAF